MRIISGEHRGRVLKTPKGEATRPTTDRVREALMSALVSARGGFEGAVVLDAFAGSGALGLEALSRGAASAYFCERDGMALRVIEENIRVLELDDRRAHVQRVDVLKDPPLRVLIPFDIVFLDPPYAFDPVEVLRVPTMMGLHGTLAGGSFIVYEHTRKMTVEVDKALQSSEFLLASRKKYGDTVVDIMRSPDTAADEGAEKFG